jgi:dCTP deaminase
MILNDRQIDQLARAGMIEPYSAINVREVDHNNRIVIENLPMPSHASYAELVSKQQLPNLAKTRRVISFGVSSFGYDLRLSEDVELFSHDNCGTIDPKNFNPKNMVKLQVHEDETGRYVLIPPHGFCLGRSVEYFRIPRNVACVVQGKSTYARCGINTNVTPLEPMWEGHVTLEISNTTHLPVKVYVNEGLCQVLFFQGEQPMVSYADKNGKYQGQTGITYPKV